MCKPQVLVSSQVQFSICLNCKCLQGKTKGHTVHPLAPLPDHSQRISRNMPQDSNHGIFKKSADLDSYFASVDIAQK